MEISSAGALAKKRRFRAARLLALRTNSNPTSSASDPGLCQVPARLWCFCQGCCPAWSPSILSPALLAPLALLAKLSLISEDPWFRKALRELLPAELPACRSLLSASAGHRQVLEPVLPVPAQPRWPPGVTVRQKHTAGGQPPQCPLPGWKLQPKERVLKSARERGWVCLKGLWKVLEGSKKAKGGHKG